MTTYGKLPVSLEQFPMLDLALEDKTSRLSNLILGGEANQQFNDSLKTVQTDDPSPVQSNNRKAKLEGFVRQAPE